jgi:zinc-finger of transposase IS204/IS1001/IS1096/IS1165
VGQYGSASGSILLGLDGFEVTAAEVINEEWRLTIQTTATTVGCAACGSQARLHARRMVRVRDLPIGGRPVVLAWRNGSGAVGSRPAGSRPGPSSRPPSGLGGADRTGSG